MGQSACDEWHEIRIGRNSVDDIFRCVLFIVSLFEQAIWSSVSNLLSFSFVAVYSREKGDPPFHRPTTLFVFCFPGTCWRCCPTPFVALIRALLSFVRPSLPFQSVRLFDLYSIVVLLEENSSLHDKQCFNQPINQSRNWFFSLLLPHLLGNKTCVCFALVCRASFGAERLSFLADQGASGWTIVDLCVLCPQIAIDTECLSISPRERWTLAHSADDQCPISEA